MSWFCEYCSGENDENTYTCEHCGYEYGNEYYENEYYAHETADVVESDVGPKFKSYKKKSVCDNCYHKHYDGQYCHVYIEKEIILVDNDDSIGNSDNDDFSGSDGEVSIKADDDGIEDKVDQKRPGIKAEIVPEPLITPDNIKRCGFQRCNCSIGIPAGDIDFIPLPKPYYVDNIKILTYEFQHIEPPSDIMGYAYDRNIQRLNKEISLFLPLILSFIPHSICANAAITCSHWNNGTNMYGEYVDIRNCVPWQVYRPHIAQVRHDPPHLLSPFSEYLYIYTHTHTGGCGDCDRTPSVFRGRQASVCNGHGYWGHSASGDSMSMVDACQS